MEEGAAVRGRRNVGALDNALLDVARGVGHDAVAHDALGDLQGLDHRDAGLEQGREGASEAGYRGPLHQVADNGDPQQGPVDHQASVLPLVVGALEDDRDHLDQQEDRPPPALQEVVAPTRIRVEGELLVLLDEHPGISGTTLAIRMVTTITSMPIIRG